MPIREYGGYGDRPDPLSLFLNPTEEEVIRMQERIYMVCNMERIKKHYASYIFNKLTEQNPKLEEQLLRFFCTVSPIQIIEEYILFCGDFQYAFFVLCHPMTGEPSIVVDAFDFLPTRQNYSRQERDLFDHIQERKTEEAFLSSPLVNQIGKSTGKYGIGYALGKGGEHLSQRGGRLQAVAKHYSSPHLVNKRVTHSIRGKAAQQKAFAELFRKSAKYNELTRQHTGAGKILGVLAKKTKLSSFKLVGTLSAFTNVTPVARANTPYNNEQSMRISIKDVLSIYCEKNDNYALIMNQTYFEPF